MTFDITVFGAHHEELSDPEKEAVAQYVHDHLVEEYGIFPESVGVEGYMESTVEAGE